jgi:hypothetical protein
VFVTPLIAEKTPTTRPRCACSLRISTVREIASALPTDVPPNFITSMLVSPVIVIESTLISLAANGP